MADDVFKRGRTVELKITLSPSDNQILEVVAGTLNKSVDYVLGELLTEVIQFALKTALVEFKERLDKIPGTIVETLQARSLAKEVLDKIMKRGRKEKRP